MNSSITNGPQIDSGTCRLCNFTKKCRVLNAQYDYKGSREVYTEIIEECFGIALSVAMDGELSDRLICAQCVMRLRDAWNFKNQIQQSERKLLAKVPIKNLVTDLVNVKEEPLDIEDDYSADGDRNSENNQFSEEEVLVGVNSEMSIENETGQSLEQKATSDVRIKKEPICDTRINTTPSSYFKSKTMSTSDVISNTMSVSDVKSNKTPICDVKNNKTPICDGISNKTPISDVRMNTMSISDVKSNKTPISDVRMNTEATSDVKSNTTPISNVRMNIEPISDVGIRTETTFDAKSNTTTNISTSDIQNTDSDDESIESMPSPGKEVRLAVLNSFKRNMEKAGLVDLIPKKLKVSSSEAKKYPVKKRKNVGRSRKKVPSNVNTPKLPHHMVSKRKENNRTLVENSYVVPFTHSTATYHCFYCTNSFILVDELRKHTYEHSTKDFVHRWRRARTLHIDITRIDCRLCDASITDIDSFKQHITGVHNKVLYTDVKGEFIPFKLDSLDCLQCGENFYFFDQLMKHLPLHFGLHVCDVCGDRFVQASTLESHIRCHFKKKILIPCPICKKEFTSKRILFNHEQIVHHKIPIFKCYSCPEKFISKLVRMRHMAAVHGVKKPKVPCKICGKLYTRTNVNKHIQQVHNMNSVCHLCGDRSMYRPGLIKHLKEAHGIVNEPA